MLNVYLLLNTYCQNCTAKAPIELLENIEEKAESFSTDVKNLLIKYSITILINQASRSQSNINYNYIYVSILYCLEQKIDQNYVTSCLKYEKASHKFEADLKITLPVFNIFIIIYPQLDPFDNLEEIEMEKYSRLNAVLKSLQNLLSLSK